MKSPLATAAAVAAAAAASSSSPAAAAYGFAFPSTACGGGRHRYRPSSSGGSGSGDTNGGGGDRQILLQGRRQRRAVASTTRTRTVKATVGPLGASGGGLDEQGFRREGGAESVLGLQSSSSDVDVSAGSADNNVGSIAGIIDDGRGHINAELARSIWEWENDHLLANMTATDSDSDSTTSSASSSSSNKDNKFPAASLKFSTRAGLRIVDEIARDLLALRMRSSDEGRTRPSPSSYADLTQEGVVALMRAMAEFDPTKQDADSTFETYARLRIYRAMARAMADSASLGNPLRLPARVHETLRKADAETARLRAELEEQEGQGQQREPTIAEVAARIHVSPEKLRFYRLIARTDSVPVESTIEISDPTGSGATGPLFADEELYEAETGRDTETNLLHSGELTAEIVEEEEEWVEPHDRVVAPLRDFIPDTSGSANPDETVLNDMMRGDVDDLLRKTLDDRELEIVRLKFGLDGGGGGGDGGDGRGMSYADIGRRVGVSRQRAAQIEQRALDKLRASYSSAFIELYLDDDHSEEVSV